MKLSFGSLAVTCAVFHLSISVQAFDQTIYCGSVLISIGDNASKVVEACGRPAQVNTSYVEREASLSTHAGRVGVQLAERELVPVERWRYEARTSQLARLIVIKDGLVSEIFVGP